MKKILSLALAALMLVSIIPMAYATETNDIGGGTTIQYAGNAKEEYTITVPAFIRPDERKDITVTGTWDDNRMLTVSFNNFVDLKRAGRSETITATVQYSTATDFNGYDKASLSGKPQLNTLSIIGKTSGTINTGAVLFVKPIEGNYFGVWSGNLTYNVEMTTVNTLQPADGQIVFTIHGVEYLADEGMLWGAWVSSAYNTDSVIRIDDGDNMAIGDYSLTTDDIPNGTTSTNAEIIAGENYIASTYPAVVLD